MGRPKAILQSEFPYSVSARCINREWFELPLEHVWEILCEELYMACILHNLKVHSFVLMSNHYHLIASTPDANISECLKRFMEMTSKRIGERSKRVNRIWGARHYKTILGSQSYYLNAYKYIYFNPVKAGLARSCEAYRFSTLCGLLGGHQIKVPLQLDPLLMSRPEETLKWLNDRPNEEKWKAIRSSLKKARFKHVKCPQSRRQVLADDEVI